jgi:hypothetical protein
MIIIIEPRVVSGHSTGDPEGYTSDEHAVGHLIKLAEVNDQNHIAAKLQKEFAGMVACREAFEAGRTIEYIVTLFLFVC